MASNAVLSERRQHAPRAAWGAHLAIDSARPSRPRVVTEAEDIVEQYDLGLRAGVKVQFKPDRNNAFPPGLLSIANAIREIEGLSPGWDSYSSFALSDQAVLPAIELAIEGLRRGQEPAVIPLPTGGLGLRWRWNGRELDVDIGFDGLCTALLEESTGEVVEINVATSHLEFVPLIHRFCRVD